MRYLLFLLCLIVALGGCTAQPLPDASPTATEIAQAPSPTPTPSPTATPTPTPTATPAPTPTPTETPTPEPTATPTVQPTPAPEPQQYVVLQQINVYESPDEASYGGYIIPGKKFIILKEEDGWLYIRLEAGGEGWIKVSETAYRPASAAKCEFERCECYREIALYSNATDEESFSTLVPGTNKTFVVKERRDGRMLIKVTEPSGDTWVAWADDIPSAYGPVGAVPPTPTPETPPAAVCTEPYWKERTAEGRAGIVNYFGEQMQLIEPERPYIMKYYRAYIGGPWYTSRDARIIQIDKQAQVVIFQLSDGSTRQRRFTRDTIMIMESYNKYRGMPETESVRYGGNLCHLGIGDAVSLLHPHEPESANPNSNLIDLFGVLFVQ